VVLITPHVQFFESLVDTLTASTVSACYPHINFCSVPCLLVAAPQGAPSHQQTHSHRHNFLPLIRIPLSCVSVLVVVLFQ